MLLNTSGILNTKFTDKDEMYRRVQDFVNQTIQGEKQQYLKIPLAPMGILATGSAHARPSGWHPIDMSKTFLPHMSAKSHSDKET